jgi:hypothetical protein
VQAGESSILERSGGDFFRSFGEIDGSGVIEAIERMRDATTAAMTNRDIDGDGQVRQQPLRECRSWYYFSPCVDTRRG